MKKITVLGSTGSVGKQALDVIEKSEELTIAALAAHSNAVLMERQIRKFSPEAVALCDENAARDLRVRTGDTKTRILGGVDGVCEIAAMSSADMVLTAMSGSAGIMPTFSAIREGKDIALANKETMVCAGELINNELKKTDAVLIPVDSEHSAIFQCIGSRPGEVKRILLTASGGPFFGKTLSELAYVTVRDALRHPNWDMGAKITIDSATIFNKGLEVIEAVRIFGVEPSQISVLVHRQSIIHSMVEFVDNCTIAQLGAPDMRTPIAYALNYPNRVENSSDAIDFTRLSALTFEEADTKTFRGLSLAFDALREGGTMPAVYSGANEAAVEAFINRKCSFLQIADLVEHAMQNHKTVINPNLESIISSDIQARETVLEKLEELH